MAENFLNKLNIRTTIGASDVRLRMISHCDVQHHFRMEIYDFQHTKVLINDASCQHDCR
jgi:hypothetical protein